MIERTYRISDVVNEDFLRFPLTLLANPKYRTMSLEAKFIYSLLLNRLTLSQKNGWINKDNEVYLIYTREEASETLNISYKKAIAAFKELIENGLLHEHRQGRGYPNLLYVLKAELSDEDAADFSEDFEKTPNETEPQEALEPVMAQNCQNSTSRTAESAYQELPKPQVLTCQNGTSGTAETACQDLPKPHPIKIDNINNKNIQIERSQSIRPARARDRDEQADRDFEELENIYEQCEFSIFQPNIRVMLQNAIERLYYSEMLKIGNARLPQAKVRSYLHLLDAEVLTQSLESMKENEDRIRNPTAYLMSTIFNGICEKDSDLILSLPPQYINEQDFYVPAEDYWKGGIKDAPK